MNKSESEYQNEIEQAGFYGTLKMNRTGEQPGELVHELRSLWWGSPAGFSLA